MPPRILVVDDEPNLARSLAELLRDEGYDVLEAGNGASALSRLFASRVDVIVSDVMMPSVDGYKLVEALRSRGDRTPVILMSASGLPRTNSPNVWSLAKPFDLELILGLVEKILAMRAVPRNGVADGNCFRSEFRNT